MGARAAVLMLLLLLQRASSAFLGPSSSIRSGSRRRGRLLLLPLASSFHVTTQEDLSDRPHPNAGPVLFLLDGTSMLYKAYFSKMELQDYDPELERPLVLLANDLARLVRDQQPTHLVSCFDYVGHRNENIRRAIFPPYKANRDDTPAAMATLVPQAMRMFEALGVPCSRRRSTSRTS